MPCVSAHFFFKKAGARLRIRVKSVGDQGEAVYIPKQIFDEIKRLVRALTHQQVELNMPYHSISDGPSYPDQTTKLFSLGTIFLQTL